MAQHLLHRLTDIAVKKAKAGRHTDGGGLYLVVRPSGGRSWMLRVQRSGPDGQPKRTDVGLGGYPRVSLDQARRKARELRDAVKERNDDPIAVRDAPKQKPKVHTFSEAMDDAHKALSPQWAVKTAAAFKKSLDHHIVPTLGQKNVASIERSDLIAALAPVWTTKPQIARKLRVRIAQVLDFAEGKGWRVNAAPTIRVGKHLPKQPKSKNFAAMPYRDVPGFIAEQLALEETASRLALIFLILTAARSGEVRGALWSEINLDSAEWRIPAERMKARVAHVVTLSTAALAILQRAKVSFGDSGLVFPGQRRGSPMSDMTMSKLMQKVDAVPHGFRSSFSVWGAECGIPRELVEHSLAHAVGNQVERAYQRSDLRERRRAVLEAWGQFAAPSLSSGGSNVIQIPGARAA